MYVLCKYPTHYRVSEYNDYNSTFLAYVGIIQTPHELFLRACHIMHVIIVIY